MDALSGWVAAPLTNPKFSMMSSIQGSMMDTMAPRMVAINA